MDPMIICLSGWQTNQNSIKNKMCVMLCKMILFQKTVKIFFKNHNVFQKNHLHFTKKRASIATIKNKKEMH